MNENDLLLAIGEIGDKYAEEAEPGAARKKRRRNTLRVLCAAAAFVILVCGTVMTVRLIRDLRPHVLTPDDYGMIAAAGAMDGGTNQYQRLKLNDGEPESFGPLPETGTVDYLIAERDTKFKKRVRDFAGTCAALIRTFYGVPAESVCRFGEGHTAFEAYDIASVFISDDLSGEAGTYDIHMETGSGYTFGFSTELEADLSYLSFYNPEGRPIRRTLLSDSSVVDVASIPVIGFDDTDEEILQKLAPITDLLRQTAGSRFDGVSVTRGYLKQTYENNDPRIVSMSVRVRLYDSSRVAVVGEDGLSFSMANSDFISFSVSTDGEANDFNKAGLSVKLTTVNMERNTADLISLAEAEEMLAKGWCFVTGGCPTCRALQDPVDFSDYDGVRLEYRSKNGSFRLPVYAFYKKLNEENPNLPEGKAVYAVTYVAAVRMEGMEEYFENLHKYGTAAAYLNARALQLRGIDPDAPLQLFGKTVDFPPEGSDLTVDSAFYVDNGVVPGFEFYCYGPEWQAKTVDEWQSVKLDLLRQLNEEGWKLLVFDEDGPHRLTPEEASGRGSVLLLKGLKYYQLDMKRNGAYWSSAEEKEEAKAMGSPAQLYTSLSIRVTFTYRDHRFWRELKDYVKELYYSVRY